MQQFSYFCLFFRCKKQSNFIKSLKLVVSCQYASILSEINLYFSVVQFYISLKKKWL